jgi:hypothetical protein
MSRRARTGCTGLMRKRAREFDGHVGPTLAGLRWPVLEKWNTGWLETALDLGCVAIICNYRFEMRHPCRLQQTSG